MRDVREELQQGVELFNRGEYFAAHEVLEEAWVRSAGAERLFLQALIHCAVAWHHAGQGNLAGAIRQARKGSRKLAGYLPQRHGIDTWSLYLGVQEWREAWSRGEAPPGRATIGVKA